MASRDKIFLLGRHPYSFKDFEDVIQPFSAKAEGDMTAIITRNKQDFLSSEIPVYSPEEFLLSCDNSAVEG